MSLKKIEADLSPPTTAEYGICPAMWLTYSVTPLEELDFSFS